MKLNGYLEYNSNLLSLKNQFIQKGMAFRLSNLPRDCLANFSSSQLIFTTSDVITKFEDDRQKKLQ